MSTKFAKFLEESKIDPRRLIAASQQLERLTREDREFIAVTARIKSLAGKKTPATVEKKKLHTGRYVSPALITAASVGKSVSGPAKSRVLRAVNRILEQRKLPAVELRALF